MKNVLLLVKNQLLAFFAGGSSLNKNNGTKPIKKRVVTTSLIFLMFAIMAVAYSIIYGNLFHELGFDEYLPALSYVLFSFSILIYNAFDSSGVLFGYKDYDLLSSMPFKKEEIVFSKLISLYLFDMLISTIIIIPANCVYAYFVPQGAIFFVAMIINAIVVPLIPYAITVVLAVLVKFIVSRMKHKKIVETLSLLLFVVLIFSIGFFGSDETVTALGNSVLNFWYISFYLSTFNNLLYLFIFVLVSVVLFVAVCLFVSSIYHKLYSVLMRVHTKGNYKVKKNKETSVFFALVKKEYKLLFSIPMYSLNSLTGVFLILIISVAVFIVSLVQSGLFYQFNNYFLIALFPVFCFFFGISSST
ncbi:MAG: hypothetical protein MJ072_02340, partial [Clostridia bacterium]|nr:hypothetical protein [Clostridia bacterium]